MYTKKSSETNTAKTFIRNEKKHVGVTVSLTTKPLEQGHATAFEIVLPNAAAKFHKIILAHHIKIA